MQIYRKKQPLRQALQPLRQQGHSIALVATMGNLHEGHIQLLQLAKKYADTVVASIFVNPLQFGLNEDWEQYPRTFEADCDALTANGCDFLFAPEDNEMYPHGLADQTRVFCPTMTNMLCGASRPGHFEGVTTVVSKLFHIIQPNTAVFGSKDYQQLSIIKRLVEDLCMDIDIIEAPIARQADQLPYSSRNGYLTAEEESKAVQLYHSLCWIREQITEGRRDYGDLEKTACKQIEEAGFRPDYVSVCNSSNLEKAAFDDHNLIILGAMYSRAARLIDNLALRLIPNGQASKTR